MKKILIIIFISIASFANSQNLFNNGSLEDMYSCQIGGLGNALDSIKGWYSTEYLSVQPYNNCIGLWSYAIPNNRWGSLYPRTGNTYVDLTIINAYVLLNSDTNTKLTKSYLGLKLPNTLDSGITYNLRMYISLADTAGNRIAIDSLGVSFWDYKYEDTSTITGYVNRYINPDTLRMAYDTSGYYTDTNWQEVFMQYTAEGDEQYLVIGDYKTSYQDTSTYLLIDSVYDNTWGYTMFSTAYLFDDFAIWPADTIPPAADSGNDTTICKGMKAKLGTHNYSDYIYQWSTDSYNLPDSNGVQWVSPDTTTSYYLLATDDIFTKTYDTITVNVLDCGVDDTTVCVESFFNFNALYNSNWNYNWSPSTYLSNSNIHNPNCSPLNSINYQLLIINNAGDTILIDTTEVKVGNCYYANAGFDRLICKNDSTVIGKFHESFLNFSWTPNYNISNVNIGQPTVWPDTATYYYLQLSDTMGNISYDSVLIDVQVCDGINEITNKLNVDLIPNPNNGEFNVNIEIHDIPLNFEIFDITGKLIYTKSLNKRVNSINISDFDKGVYVYKVYNNDQRIGFGKFIKM